MAYGPLRAYVAFLGVCAIVFGYVPPFREWLLLTGAALIGLAAWDGRPGVRVTTNLGRVFLAWAATVGLFIGYAVFDASRGDVLAGLRFGGLFGAPFALAGLVLQAIGQRPRRPAVERESLPRWL